jgi:hypothetical protein
MTNDQIRAWLKKYEPVHGKEIGLRVDQTKAVLTELLELRERMQRIAATVDAAIAGVKARTDAPPIADPGGLRNFVEARDTLLNVHGPQTGGANTEHIKP